MLQGGRFNLRAIEIKENNIFLFTTTLDVYFSRPGFNQSGLNEMCYLADDKRR